MKKNIFQGARYGAGLVLILIGLIGLVVPFLQGWLLIFAGAFLINPKWAKRSKEKIERWFGARGKTSTGGHERRGSESSSR